MDFMVSLPQSTSKTNILVVVDKLTKVVHFMVLVSPMSVLTIARAFSKHVAKLHGMPRSIISDRNRIVPSNLWKDLFKLQGTQLYRSTTYHPESDDQTEVRNRCVQQYLRCFVMDNPSNWPSYLHLPELWFKTSTSLHHSRQPSEIGRAHV